MAVFGKRKENEHSISHIFSAGLHHRHVHQGRWCAEQFIGISFRFDEGKAMDLDGSTFCCLLPLCADVC